MNLQNGKPLSSTRRESRTFLARQEERDRPAHLSKVHDAAHELRYAAVMIPIFANPPHELVFVERGRHLRRHAGEIAFPGGALDAADGGDHARAAIREVHEEIGVPPDAVALVGQLRPFMQRKRAFCITPFVGVVVPGTPLVPDGDEIVAVHCVPLAAVAAPGAIHRGLHETSEGQIETYQFDHHGLHVWGLTATILNEFVARYSAHVSPLRDALEARVVA